MNQVLNPAGSLPSFHHSNLCHQWLTEGAVRTLEPQPDAGEDIAVVEHSVDELKDEIRTGRLLHSLALSALSRVFHLFEDLERFGFREPG